MTRDELIASLSERYCENFATTLAARVIAADAVGLLYEVATACHKTLPAACAAAGESDIGYFCF